MAGRNIKIGLSYFPMDVDFFSDIKIRKLIKYKSANVITVYINLLCAIYRDGYYIKWDSDMPFIIAEATGYDEDYIIEILTYCIEIDLFSKQMFNKFSILTSKGIQERYKMICDLRKGKATINEFSLINSELIPINTEEILINTELIPITSELMQQRKGSKEKEREGKKTPFQPPIYSEVAIYFEQNGYTGAEKFHRLYDQQNWKDTHGNIIRDWKKKADDVWFKPENKKHEFKSASQVPPFYGR